MPAAFSRILARADFIDPCDTLSKVPVISVIQHVLPALTRTGVSGDFEWMVSLGAIGVGAVRVARLRAFLSRHGAGRCFCVALAVLALAGCERQRAVDRATQEGILLVGSGPEPERLDPHLTTSVSAFNILFALFEGLVAPHPRTLEPVPGAAARWTVDDDGMEYRFFLHPEARWSDGERVTAEDFVFSWKRLLSPALGAPYATMLYAVKGAESFHRGEDADFGSVGVEAVSPGELRVTLRAPAPHFLQLLMHPASFPVRESALRAEGDPFHRDTRWAVPGRLIGNGPFSLARWRANQLIEVVPNAHYWDADTVSLNGIHFFPIADLGAEERAFQAGQLHVTEALPPPRARHYQRNEPEVLRIDPYLGTYYYLFNHNRPPLDDWRVRRALSLAIDRRAITDGILGAGQMPAMSFTPPGLGTHTPPSMPPGDLDEARRLLAEAGFPGGGGFPRLELLYNTSESHQRIAEAVQAMWRRELGIEVRLRNVEFRVYLDLRAGGDFDIARAAWIGDYLDPHTFLSLWTGASANNFSGWSDPAYDALIARSDRIRDTEARNAVFAEAETMLLERQVVCPIYTYVTVYLIRPEVRGWYANLLDWHPYKHVRLEAVESPKAP